MSTETAVQILAGVGVVITLITLWQTSKQHKKAKKFDEQFDFAKRFLTLAHSFEEAFKNMQGKLVVPDDDYDGRPKAYNETLHEKWISVNRYGQSLRLDPMRQAVRDMVSLNLEAKASLGEDFREYIEVYQRTVFHLEQAIKFLFDADINVQTKREDLSDSMNEVLDYSRGVLMGYDFGESIRQQVIQNTKDVETRLRKYTFQGRRS